MISRTVGTGLACAAFGIGVGWWLAGGASPPLRAVAAVDQRAAAGPLVASGAVAMRPVRLDAATTVALPQDAIYYLDYERGSLLASVPQQRSTVEGTSILGDFAARDLVADFRPPAGTTPRFLMTVGSLGDQTGWAPLYVFEAETRQVATYKVVPGGVTVERTLPPRFELVEIRRLP